MKTPESREKFAQKILEKNSHKWGIYRPQKNCWQQKMPEIHCRSTGPVDRPTVKFCPLAANGRPPRSTQTNRELCSQTRSTLTVDRPCVCKTCTDLCTSVDRPGRPTSCQVDLFRRQVDWLKPGTETWVRKTV